MTATSWTWHRLVSPGGVGKAVVSRLAAALCVLRVRGVGLVGPSASPRDSSVARAVLAPSPCRVDGATWNLVSRAQQLEITGPGFGPAIHGRRWLLLPALGRGQLRPRQQLFRGTTSLSRAHPGLGALVARREVPCGAPPMRRALRTGQGLRWLAAGGHRQLD